MDFSTENTSGSVQKVKVWDAPVRLFHWTLAAAIFFMWFSADQGGSWLVWHLRCGLLVIALVVFRIIWGFVGSDTARFAQFVKGPGAIRRYLNNDFSENRQPGHNPLGALSVLLMLAAVLFQAATGLFSSDANSYLYPGYWQHLIGSEAGDAVRTVHVNFFWFLLALVVLHIAAVVFYKIVKKHNLIHPMLSGFKYLSAPLPRLAFVSPLKALAIFAVVALAVFVGIPAL